MQNLLTIRQASSVTHLFRNHVQACLADLNMRTSSEHCDEDIKIERRADEKALQRGGPLSVSLAAAAPCPPFYDGGEHSSQFLIMGMKRYQETDNFLYM